jgi:uncharacterized protein (TIGR03435 family)
MMSPEFWNGALTTAWTAALVNHLWQSTVVTLLAWLLALTLRSNHARTRYWLWMIASVKFLLPFSLLISAGEWLRPAVATPLAKPAFAAAMKQITQPFPQSAMSTSVDFIGNVSAPAAHHSNFLPLFLAAVWLCGAFAIALSWARSWWRIRATVRTAVQATSPTTLLSDVPVLSSPRLLEPGVFGIVHPVLLLPENITERLSTQQLDTIIAHEMCHVRRRDNLTAAIHMVVQTTFWFHPAVWWIKARLLEERERACDEAVLQSGNQAELYAESILNVCKFYVESPLACMSGVTGSDLKRRIVHIMTEQVSRKLDFSRKLLLGIAAFAAVAVPVVFGLMHVAQVQAQATADKPSEGIAGTWQGTLHAGRDLRTVYKISKANDGSYKAVLFSIDQSGDGISASKITLDGTDVKISITAIGGSFEGKLSADGKTISGNWSQGPNPLPLVLTRTTPETEWTIPPPTPKIPPMDTNADPSFEVATVKPSKPDQPGRAFLVQGRHFKTINTTLVSLITFSYGVHAKQIVGAPDWADTDKYDMDAQPDGEGAPNDKQWKSMIRKLLAERFQLTLHQDKKELSVYVLSVAKSGPKLTKSEGDPNGLPALFFPRRLGELNVRNANMDDFAHLMQSAVLDRPVVDQTGLTGRFDFTLNWTPDDSQFGGMGARLPPPTDSTNAPPNLYTAIQEQIGLKLDATKAPAEVLIIDRVEKPSDN